MGNRARRSPAPRGSGAVAQHCWRVQKNCPPALALARACIRARTRSHLQLAQLARAHAAHASVPALDHVPLTQHKVKGSASVVCRVPQRVNDSMMCGHGGWCCCVYVRGLSGTHRMHQTARRHPREIRGTQPTRGRRRWLRARTELCASRQSEGCSRSLQTQTLALSCPP